MRRREFSRKVRAQIILRATSAANVLACEGCGLILGKKPYEINHIVAEALVIDKSAPLTASDGQLLGKACCHRRKTAGDIGRIRKAGRQRDKSTGAVNQSSRPMPGSRASGWRKPMNGPAERRT